MEQTNILKQFNPENVFGEIGEIEAMVSDRLRDEAFIGAVQCKDAKAMKSLRVEFVLAEMLAVISADKLRDKYHGNNVDSLGIGEVEAMVSDLLRDKAFTGEVYGKKIGAIKDILFKRVTHSFSTFSMEVRQESLTALKLSGLSLIISEGF